MNSTCLAEIVIPKFITKVQISGKVRPKYYSKKDKKKNIPPTYLKKYKFNKSGFLINKDGERVLKNPKLAGNAKYEVLSGNNLLSGYGSPFIRAKLVNELKGFYRPFVADYIKNHGPIIQYPLQVTWDLYTIVDENSQWDASNLFFYYKYFEDCLFENPQLIPDDNIKYITWSPGPKIIPIDNWEDRKFVFKFFYDERKELKREPWKQT